MGLELLQKQPLEDPQNLEPLEKQEAQVKQLVNQRASEMLKEVTPPPREASRNLEQVQKAEHLVEKEARITRMPKTRKTTRKTRKKTRKKKKVAAVEPVQEPREDRAVKHRRTLKPLSVSV